MTRNLFVTVMEAEGDLLQPFEGDMEETMPADAAGDQAPSEPPPGDTEGPPPIADDGDLQYTEDDQMTEPGQEGEEEGASETPMADKANNVLNQKLYEQFMERNRSVEETIESLNQLIPLIPLEVVNQNDETLNKLKTALAKGQDYVTNVFVSMGYGENLLMYQKLDALYTMLLNALDSNLKKIQQ